MTVESDMDSFFRSVRDEPEVAIKKIKSDNSLVMSVWNGDPGLIIGSTPLHWASHDGHLELVKLLVELGAKINSDSADWWCRPIDWAVDSAQYEVAEYLIKNGASLSGDKWSNCTPLHVVAQGGSSNGSEKKEAYIKTAEVLINAGAGVNTVAKYGGQPPEMTPLDDALNAGNTGVADLLKLKGGLRFIEM